MAGSKKGTVINGIHSYSTVDKYIAPQEPILKEQLKQFQNHKLGIMMHWAPGCQLGIFESWCMSDDSARWSKGDVDWTDDMNEFREQYKNMYKSFNPIRFQPDKWAELAYECGFKYLLFTTKHHDGFCMWDTKTTNHKITNKDCPFCRHKYADICKNLFEEFRKRGMSVHTYFSKPDWNSPHYWVPQFEDPNGKTQRNVNYDVSEHPELWDKFVNYTHEQITELMTNYGKIDVLWLDGGWVRPDNKGQDIRLGEIVEKVRKTTQPHLIVADRTVGGEFENIITPEQAVPGEALLVPWESCVTLGNRFSFNYDDEYKTPRQIINMLIDVVSKGGNLALNITPQPDGRLPQKGIKVLRELGEFMKVNGEAIYDTTVHAPYFTENLAFTRKDNYIYVFYPYKDENSEIMQSISVPLTCNIRTVKMLSDNLPVEVRCSDGQVVLKIPQRNIDKAPYADVFCIEIC